MSDEPLAALRTQLRASPPPALRGLSGADLDDLAAAVEAARRRQAAELAAAGDLAFNHIPRLLRGPIRRVLG
jgi:hypothetical protein